MANEVRVIVSAQDRTKGVFGGMRASMAGLTAAFAGAGLVVAKFFSDSIAEATEAKKVMAQTHAVLKSTGSVAGISAKGVEKLAGAISAKTGIDDEAIQSGENLLLTFTNIRNEAGKGNQVFTQATKVITDMSVALGQDMKSSAIQVGKALNDPVKGMTALSRVGVSFTEKQKDMVKHLEKTGHHLEAQKIILHELKKEFGGSAQAAATWGEKARVASDNIKESFGKKLLPGLERVSKWFTKKGTPALQEFVDSIDSNKINDTADAIITIGDAVGKITKVLGKWDKVNGRAFTTFGVNIGLMGKAWTYWKAKALGAMDAVAGAMAKLHLIPKKFANAVHAMRVKADADVNKLADSINTAKIKAKVKADISNLQDRIRDAKQRLKETHNQKTKPKIQAEINQLRAQVAAAKRALASIHDKKVRIIVTRTNAPGYGIKGPGVATGGFIGGRSASHAAEGGPRGGQTWVGEHGPELVDLPLGSHVNSNPDSMQQMAKGGRGGGPHLHFHFDRYTGSTTDLVRDLVNAKKRGQLDVLFR